MSFVVRSDAPTRQLPDWLAWPVLIVAPLSVVGLLLVAARQPLSLPLSLVALFVPGSTLWALGHYLPHALWPRVACFLWGAVLATALSLVVEELFSSLWDSKLALVGCAAIIEEVAKFSALF